MRSNSFEGRLRGVIVTDVRTPQATYDTVCEAARCNGLPKACVLAPEMLRISENHRTQSAGREQ